jgi:hypothetical protein
MNKHSICEAKGTSPLGRAERSIAILDQYDGSYAISVGWGEGKRRGCFLTATELLAFLEDAQKAVLKTEAQA